MYRYFLLHLVSLSRAYRKSPSGSVIIPVAPSHIGSVQQHSPIHENFGKNDETTRELARGVSKVLESDAMAKNFGT